MEREILSSRLEESASKEFFQTTSGEIKIRTTHSEYGKGTIAPLPLFAWLWIIC
jgi:hypothetical protein